MLGSRVRQIRSLLVLASLQNLLIQNAFCAPQGVVGIGVVWGTSTRASYTIVFSGVVTCQGRPCSDAQINLDIDTASRGVISQAAQAGSDGRYQLEVTLQGSPDDSSAWKLQASKGGIKGQQSGEAEGRLILMEGQTSVVVNRSLKLVQA